MTGSVYYQTATLPGGVAGEIQLAGGPSAGMSGTTLAALFAAFPTTEPVAIGVPWRDPSAGGAIKHSVGIPPAFTTHPLSQTIDEGSTVTFTWAATNATSFQLQKQEGGVGAWANVSGATSSPWTSGALTSAADNADVYRVSSVGPGGTANSNSATLTVLPAAPLTGITAAVAISTKYLVPAWQASGRATVYVEKGWASGVFQNLYPHTDGKLYTATAGGGTEASVWAAGSRLFVTTPYNQCLASEVASGHPTAITDNTRRVLLDLTTTTDPCFAGYSTGTQDGSQHATQRGYDLNVSVTTNQGLTFISMDRPAGSETSVPWQNNGGSTLNCQVRAANGDWYPNPGVSQALTYPAGRPHFRASYHDPKASLSTNDEVFSYSWGNPQEHALSGTVNATSTPMRVWGTTSSLQGKAWAFVLVTGYLTHANMTYTALPQKFAALCKNNWAAAELAVVSPRSGQLFPMDNLGAGTGPMPIVVMSGASRAIEASWNGAAYATIGTTDSNGQLIGSIAAAAKGSGTLNVRVVGQATVTGISNVRMGILLARMGQSNSDGRGDDITLSVTRSICTYGWITSTATQKSWIWALAQSLATTHSCPVGISGFTNGAAYLARASGATNGHWHPLNDGAANVSHFNSAMANLIACRSQPNYIVWHQGEEDANDGVSAAQYETAIGLFIDELRTRTGWSSVKLHVMQIGRNNPVSDAATNAVRYGQRNAWDNNSGKISAGGCLAHLACGDGGTDEVHFWTQAQKDAVVAVFIRHTTGSGRAHQYGSGSKTTNTCLLNFTGGSGDLVDGASPTVGWTCTDGGGSITVTGAVCSGDSITLTFNRTISGSLLVKWCSGDDGITCTIRDSDATTPLPPEPFEVTL